MLEDSIPTERTYLACLPMRLLIAVRFGISKPDAEDILKIIRDNWEKTAVGYGLTRRQIEEMRPAFSACY